MEAVNFILRDHPGNGIAKSEAEMAWIFWTWQNAELPMAAQWRIRYSVDVDVDVEVEVDVDADVDVDLDVNVDDRKKE